jgi:hypothetical protein
MPYHFPGLIPGKLPGHELPQLFLRRVVLGCSQIPILLNVEHGREASPGSRGPVPSLRDLQKLRTYNPQ